MQDHGRLQPCGCAGARARSGGSVLKLAAVERYAREQGVGDRALEQFRRDALMLGTSRLLQAARRERYGGATALERGRDGRAWLVAGSDPALRLPVSAPVATDRVEALGPPLLRAAGLDRRIETAAGFVDALRRAWADAPGVPFDRLAEDFENSHANMVLNRVLYHLQPARSPAFEAAFEGHNSYPFPALRIGPSVADVAACSPLSAAAPELPLVVPAERRFISVCREDGDAFRREWAGAAASVDENAIPLHPWQLALSEVVRGCRALGLVRLAPGGVRAMPLASQRTCRVLATGYDLKLPVDATLTGERRLLAPLNAVNAPAVSALASACLASDGPETLGLQCDLATMLHPDEVVGGHVAAIVRAPLPEPDGAAEQIVPALLLWTGPTLAGALMPVRDASDACELFLDYLRALMRGPVEFYARWGLAFEPHLQNTLIRIRAGRPVGIVLRDLDGTILDRNRAPGVLAANGIALAAEPWASMPRFEQGGQRLMFALITGHMSQVMSHLVLHARADERELRVLIDQVWEELLGAHTGASRERIAELRALTPTVKRLLTTRMKRAMELSFAAA